MADAPRLTVRCEYPDTDMPPTEVTFGLSPSYGLTTGHERNSRSSPARSRAGMWTEASMLNPPPACQVSMSSVTWRSSRPLVSKL